MLANHFELRCVLQVGLGTLCMTAGYDTLGMLSQTFMSQQHKLHPEAVGEHAGYIGLCIVNIVYMLSCLFIPFLLLFVHPKWILFVSSLCFTVFSAGFIHINVNLFFLSCAAVGLGHARLVKHAGTGIYLTGHSERTTLERNTAIVWAIACFSFLVGSATTASSAYFSTNSDSQIENDSVSTQLIVGSVFTSISLLANIIFFFLPSENTPNCIANEQYRTISIRSELAEYAVCLRHPSFLLLSPLFVLCGIHICFFGIILPTALSRQSSMGIYSASIYILSVGAGEIATSLLISALPRKSNHVWCTLLLSVITTISGLIIVVILVPSEDTKNTKDAVGLLTLIGSGIFLGSSDASLNTSRSVIITLSLPENRIQAFPLSKFIQAAASAILMSVASRLVVVQIVHILSICNIIAMISCFVLSRRSSVTTD